MKKIKCSVNPEDFIKVQGDGWVEDGNFAIDLHADSGRVILSPSKIRKLRKQLKRALIEIEGEKKEDDWFSAGKIVRVTNKFMGHGFPIGDMVRIVDINEDGVAKAEYLDGRDYWFLRKNECGPAA